MIVSRSFSSKLVKTPGEQLDCKNPELQLDFACCIRLTRFRIQQFLQLLGLQEEHSRRDHLAWV